MEGRREAMSLRPIWAKSETMLQNNNINFKIINHFEVSRLPAEMETESRAREHRACSSLAISPRVQACRTRLLDTASSAVLS